MRLCFLAAPYLLAALIFILSFSAFAGSEKPVASPPTKEERDFLARLSLEQKVGQLFMFGFMGEEMTPKLAETLSELQPGGLILFNRNIKTANQTAQLIYSAQLQSIKSSKIPLFISVDQEGGDVIRIKTSPPLPSALALGQSGNLELVETAGRETGLILKALGFNMNLAPVLDVADPNKASFIGTRAFGNDPKNVGQLGTLFASGLSKAGILPTAKHFPGHGETQQDSHLLTPVREISEQQIWGADLVPYNALSQMGYPSAIMIAHVAYPKIDPTGTPATFSKKIITDILRKRIGFNGLVLTDDIEMVGAAAMGDPAHRALAAIKAGADMIMLAWNRSEQMRVVRAVRSAVRSGEISEARIDESIVRIYRAKLKYVSFATPVIPLANSYLPTLRNSRIKNIADRTLERSFLNSVQGIEGGKGHGRLPSSTLASGGKVLVLALGDQFYKSFRDTARKNTVRFYPIDKISSAGLSKLLGSDPDMRVVYYVSGPKAARALNALDSNYSDRFIVINSGVRGLLDHPDKYATVVSAGFHHPDLGAFTARYFFNGTRKTAN